MNPLPPLHRYVLAAAALLVPYADREDWSRGWHSELWHIHQRRRSLRSNVDLAAGIASDAAWLRAEALRLRFSGSPILCMVTLAASCILCVRLVYYFSGGFNQLIDLSLQLRLSYLLGATIAITVTMLTTAEARMRYADAGRHLPPDLRAKRVCFFVTKLTLSLILGLLFTAVVFASLHSSAIWIILPQIYLTAAFVAGTLRWAVWDQQQRCQHCLHALARPSRVGRPSHNLLEWNGTERTCRHGHGSLHEPEMQTSWQESSRWVIS